MLIHSLSQYLESHKRLVVPQLGTFIVKEPGRSVLFSELLKRDDGVLRGLLREEGLGDLEAAGEIDRFVFEIRHAVQHGREFRIEGFGVMKPGPNSTIAFEYTAKPMVETVAAHAPQAEPKPAAGKVTSTVAEPRVSSSTKMNPDPSVRGLRYGKPPRNTDAYSYVDRAPRRRADRFIWIAVLAAALAVAAIAFGYFREAHDKEAEGGYNEQPLTQMQQVQSPAETTQIPGAE